MASFPSIPGEGAGGSGAEDFTELLDTPVTYLGAAGYFLKVNGTEDGVEFTAVTVGDMLKSTYDSNDDGKVDAADEADAVTGVGTAGNSKYYGTNGVGTAGFYDLPTDTDTFTGLTDTPSSYASQANKFLKVNAGATALEFVDEPSGVDTFLGLTDTPANFTGSAFKVPAVNSGETALEFVTALSTDNFAYFRDEKSATTSGGSSLAAGVQTRTLNTTVTNNITGCSLSSNQVTVDAGTYYIEATAIAYNVNRHRGFIYDATAESTVLVGTSEICFDAVGTRSFVTGILSPTVTTAYELRHYTQTAVATFGLGAETNDGKVSVYSEIRLWRVG